MLFQQPMLPAHLKGQDGVVNDHVYGREKPEGLMAWVV